MSSMLLCSLNESDVVERKGVSLNLACGNPNRQACKIGKLQLTDMTAQ